MNHLTPKEAIAQGYRAITKDLLPAMDASIIASLAQSLDGCDACWIVFPHGAIQAARKMTEIRLPDDVRHNLIKQQDHDHP